MIQSSLSLSTDNITVHPYKTNRQVIAHTLVVVSHVMHYFNNGNIYAYGPYVREIDIWADLFSEVRIAAPLRIEDPPGDALLFSRPNINMAPQLETGGSTLSAKLYQITALPSIVWSLIRVIADADVVHVRCPGNLGLLGSLLVPLFSRRRIAKYAGQWGNYPGEAFTVWLQRAILRSHWWGAPVLVYGNWPGQPVHIIPFFTSIMNDEQIAHAHQIAAKKQLGRPAEILYVGRLSASKRVDVLLRAIQALIHRQVSCRLTIVGEGSERVKLEQMTRDLGITAQVVFAGALPFERVLGYYERGHILALVSETEGWPKVIAEGMAFGLACIGSDRGAVPWLLSNGRGLTVPVGESDVLASAIEQIIRNPLLFESMSHASASWAQQFTLEGLREALRKVMKQWWKL